MGSCSLTQCIARYCLLWIASTLSTPDHCAGKPEGNWIARALKPSKGGNSRPHSSADHSCGNCQMLASELAASKKRVDKLEERMVSGRLVTSPVWLHVEVWQRSDGCMQSLHSSTISYSHAMLVHIHMYKSIVGSLNLMQILLCVTAIAHLHLHNSSDAGVASRIRTTYGGL